MRTQRILYAKVLVRCGALWGDGNLVTCNISWFRFIKKKFSSYAQLPAFFLYLYFYTEIYMYGGLPHTLSQNNNKKKREIFVFEELHKKYYYRKRSSVITRRIENSQSQLKRSYFPCWNTLHFLRLFIFLYIFFFRPYFIFIDQIYNYHSEE